SALANEAFGSFLFVLIGTSAITAINITGQATTAAVLLVGSLAFSVALGWIIFLLRRTGLVHINPAVTIFFWLNGQISISRTVFYIIAQHFGAISASVVVALMYGTTGVEARLGAPYPTTSMGEWAAFMAELLGTLILFATIRIAIARQYISFTQQSIIIGIGYGLGY